MNMKKDPVKSRIYLPFVLLAALLCLAFPARAGSKYLSIQELRENTPSEWKETIIGGKKKLECTIDAPIVFPDVDRFPVLRVAYQGKLRDLEEKGYYIEDNNGRETFVKTMPDEESEKLSEPLNNGIYLYDGDFTEEEILSADKKAREILREIWDMEGTELERLGMQATIDQGTGFCSVTVDYCPVYGGIAYLYCPDSMFRIKGHVTPPYNSVYAFWQASINFKGAFILMPRLLGEYLPDVPLLPFEEIRDIIRERVEKGYIQSISEIRLGYVCLGNPDHPGEDYYLTPAWIVCGVANHEPNLPFYPQNCTPEQRYSSPAIAIDAQSGLIFDYNSRKKDHFDAHILTWEDVSHRDGSR